MQVGGWSATAFKCDNNRASNGGCHLKDHLYYFLHLSSQFVRGKCFRDRGEEVTVTELSVSYHHRVLLNSAQTFQNILSHTSKICPP